MAPNTTPGVAAGHAELRCRSNYSFLEGASHPDELVARACEVGLSALAITDRYSLAGVVRAHAAAKLAGLKLLIGSEIRPAGQPDRRCKVAGLVLMRQRPSTAKGITFVTLEDETGPINLIVRIEVCERFPRVVRQAAAMLVTGILQSKDGIIHVMADRIEDLTELLAEVGNRSRDFR